MDNASQPGLPERSQGGGTYLNGASHRRPQTLMSPVGIERNKIDEIELTITIQKDASGYGMKVSGDKPVFVESVKTGGAAHKAGLMERDMIVKVNGEEAKTLNHTRVVHLIKDKSPVILTVSRVQTKMQRSSSISVGTPTSLTQRSPITAPLPVDTNTRRELEFTRITTLRLMLDQEKKNLENLKTSNNGNRNDIGQAETNILRLQEQLRQMHGEDPTLLHFNPISSPALLATTTPISNPQQSSLTPAFLSRFPRSLSSLSLGGKKKSIEKDAANSSLISSNTSANSDHLQSPVTSGLHHHSSHNALLSSVKNKFTSEQSVELRPGFVDKNRSKNQPPPLPLRNFPRRSQPATAPDGVDGENLIDLTSSSVTAAAVGVKKKGKSSSADIDNKTNNNDKCNKNLSSSSSVAAATSAANKVKKRNKAKIKANSDPKISAQLFIQMEREYDTQDLIAATGHSIANEPPPLPPRQPGMLEENQNLINNNKCGSSGGGTGGGVGNSRPPSNSLETRMNYPLIATATAVRDNISPFPLSNRPNIRQRLQQTNTHQHALGLTPHQINQLNNTSPHRRVVSSPEQHLHSRDSDTFDDETTPPGTPPPPYKIKTKSTASDSKHPMVPKRNYFQQASNTTQSCSNESATVQNNPNSHNLSEHDEFMANDSIFNTSTSSAASYGANCSNISAAQANILQRQIISMEDDELVDDQDSISDDHGPFKSLQQLLEPENTPYLAVFLNFVLSNSNPSQLLFYLITGLYKEGTVKDMRKWSYEIHSTFLVPRAPLMWQGVDESLAREVDDVLQNEHDKGEILRKIFWKSRHRAKECIVQQLAEFQMKRTAGLGTMFGPSDQQLLEAKGDKVKEQRIVEETLLPKLQQLLDDLDKESSNECPKKMALSSALSTVLHRVFLITRSTPGGPIERVHHFVSREKSFKSRLIGKNRKIMVRGHHLVLKQYYEVAHCNHCQNIIWGVSPQGYHCTNCELNIHRACSRVLEESCPGPVPTKNDKMSKFIEKIRPAHYFNPAERTRRQEDECGADDLLQVDRPSQASVVRQPSDRRSDANNSLNSTTQSSHHPTTNELNTSHSIDNDTSGIHTDADHDNRDSTKSKSAPVSVNRSESYKERLSHKRNHRNNRRKISDPSLSSKSNEDQHVDLGINNTNFTASSSSSLSSSLGSNSPSLEAVGTPIGGHQQGVVSAPRQWVDSEDEAGDPPEADWSSHVSADILHTLSDAEKRRQEIINEIYQTERNHVRTLKLLEGVFMRPLQESSALTQEHFTLLFPPSLLVLKDLHSTFEQQLKQRRSEHGPLVGEIGDLLLSMFDGNAGDQLREHAAQFCARQKIALEALKEKRRKDENLQRLLTKAESHKACRRLQLKDLLPTVLQRLTKYPLLFESLAKISKSTSPADNEKEAIQRSRELSRRILDHVNQAVREAEDTHTLQTIQKRLDKSLFEKEPNNEFKHLDLTQHKLIYEGTLTHKKQPQEQLHGLLFETMVVLLHKKDDKYMLKHLVSPGSTGGESKNEIRFNPITKINLILVRQSAVEKNSFYLINTNVTQMLELTAPSALECKTWFNHISAAAEAYKQRTKSQNHDMTPMEDPASVTIPSSATAKETTDHEFVTSGTSNSSGLNTSTSNASAAENVAHNQFAADGQKDAVARHNSTSNDADAFSEHDYINVNGSGARASVKLAEEDVCDKSNRKSEVYSNNSNNTRTLTQQSSLVAPSEVHVSISPALTAEPVLTPNERLRRLDESIRLTLAEKQKIVCDIFRVPNEHFSAIADIAGQPEAPKEPSDILLAAFAQVQSLTEALNEYVKIPQIKPTDMLVKSASLCDDCFKTAEKQCLEQQQQQQQQQPQSKPTTQSNSTTSISNNSSQSSSTTSTVINNNKLAELCESMTSIEAANILPDDDGYCEIDEIRLPAITKSPSIKVKTDPRRQSAAAPLPPPPPPSEANNDVDESIDSVYDPSTAPIKSPGIDGQSKGNHDSASNSEQISSTNASKMTTTNKPTADAENTEVNYAYDTLAQPLAELNLNSGDAKAKLNNGANKLRSTTCENLCSLPIELSPIGQQHAVPSIPCHLISAYVASLNLHISQLLPKLNERDIEREKLRKENQLLRDRLNSMHEQRGEKFTQSEN
ncbi:uncharacterized protein LOC129576874 isoform X3 [Sitodiplosis mosellana]|uniref:uncharacterized protein LOC129576874 isoform X3 n=1 Tax=Sitodiplosis mosellana TaxID=263140 RepID=UPI002443D043|nr:uncharacterized protein LOC129576874 isoform X3 [Sitodiplosis mosellana]XP_055318826.1 uncharacterized protein LOC129576874 isoform X3 [Sitodiplosis mosellana]XP_055318827.1 uncharacterized protein LOC129576874 isoform X3 [Sitodiplosis mosellana]XP_055318829.1 uncharacterized protein LOC129576874 isoform X3 [Sitodiplosis mosellana]XP_055318830.1 uncharacterized protein LOC129576874 isoform X3 [Sitodiplosis mosellana]XP_055318831.1 uncharacterized protein LOC129576874 isoform X3 [Sitodiplosi